jgi:hypothetical protein
MDKYIELHVLGNGSAGNVVRLVKNLDTNCVKIIILLRHMH